MIKSSYNWKDPIDDIAKWYMRKTKQSMRMKEDDRLFLVVGETGCGKSMLTFHLLEQYEPNLSMEYIVQERKDFAAALKKVKDDYIAGKRNLYLWFDEADTDNLEQQARWNKRLFSMYMKLRKLSILHFWCFPSLKAMDRRFIEEKVRGVFFCYDKAKNRPRNYCFFSKKAILAMLDEGMRLNIPTLKSAKKKYAWWLGYYKDYKGPMRAPYDAKKVCSMSDAVDDFYDEFSNDKKAKVSTRVTKDEAMADGGSHINRVAAKLGVSYSTIHTRLRSLKMRGLIPTYEMEGQRLSISPEIENMLINFDKKRKVSA